MFTLARIKPLGLGAPFGFDPSAFQMPSLDLNPIQPIFPGGLPLAAGSGNGGGNGGGAPPAGNGGAPPANGGALPANGLQPALPGYFPQPTYLFPVEEQQVPAAPAAPAQAAPTWLIAAGVVLAGLVVGSLLFRKS